MLAAYFIRLFIGKITRSLFKKPNSIRKSFFRTRIPTAEEIVAPKREMRHPNNTKRGKMASAPPGVIKQPFEVLLVLDIEGTCDLGTNYDYPNEIIVRANNIPKKKGVLNIKTSQELPVCMLRWKDRTDDGRANVLELVDEFRIFVRPIWRPTLSSFCTQLTGITQVSSINFRVVSRQC